MHDEVLEVPNDELVAIRKPWLRNYGGRSRTFVHSLQMRMTAVHGMRQVKHERKFSIYLFSLALHARISGCYPRYCGSIGDYSAMTK